jgi:hypothetical protein
VCESPVDMLNAKSMGPRLKKRGILYVFNMLYFSQIVAQSLCKCTRCAGSLSCSSISAVQGFMKAGNELAPWTITMAIRLGVVGTLSFCAVRRWKCVVTNRFICASTAKRTSQARAKDKLWNHLMWLSLEFSSHI